MQKKSGRPKGSKSNRKLLKMPEIRAIIKEYDKIADSEILRKYKISKTQLKNLKKDYKLKSKNISPYVKKILLKDIPERPGVYSIVREDGKKVYIGSSINMSQRCKNHLKALKNKCPHYNQELQTDFEKAGIYFSVCLECPEEHLLKEESLIIESLSDFTLYNKNKLPETNCIEILGGLFGRIDYSILDNGCWEPNRRRNKSGYAFLRHKKKEYVIHRLSYIFHNKELPYLVSHTCNNKWCCNPKHLENSSCRKNAQYYWDTQAPSPIKRSKLYPYINEIKTMRKKGFSYKTIAEKLPIKVHLTTIWNYINLIGRYL